MRIVLTALCCLGLATLASAQPAKHESKAGRFSATFPAKPEVKTEKSGDATLEVTLAQKGGASFLVMYADLPADDVKKSKASDILASTEKGLLGSFKTTATTSKEATVGKMKFPARHVTASQDLTYYRITLVLAENRLYQVIAVGPKGTVEGGDADKFFESFDVTK